MTAWNAEVWREEFEAAATGARKGDPEAMDRLRELRVEVFENTLETLCTGGYETPSGKEISLPDPESLAAGAVFYREAFEAAGSDPLPEGTAVTVENLDCLLAAEKLKREGLNPAVLNMANRHTPGGGVAYGAGAQEENLCRRTALYPTLERFADSDSPDCYPMDPDFGGIYSPDVPVIRTGESRGCAWLEEPFTVSFISVAAINRPALTPEGRLTPAMVAGTKNKIRTILRIGLHHRHDALVLGALGCGAFRNPPDHVAELFKEVLNEPEFKDRFRRIVFAIIEDHNSRRRHNPRGNLIPFQECFA